MPQKDLLVVGDIMLIADHSKATSGRECVLVNFWCENPDPFIPKMNSAGCVVCKLYYSQVHAG